MNPAVCWQISWLNKAMSLANGSGNLIKVRAAISGLGEVYHNRDYSLLSEPLRVIDVLKLPNIAVLFICCPRLSSSWM